MQLLEFIKKEPIYFKFLYALGCLFFMYHLNEMTNENNEVNWIYPIFSIIILVTYFIRVLYYYKKNNLF